MYIIYKTDREKTLRKHTEAQQEQSSSLEALNQAPEAKFIRDGGCSSGKFLISPWIIQYLNNLWIIYG